jgi:hypothetical protein
VWAHASIHALIIYTHTHTHTHTEAHNHSFIHSKFKNFAAAAAVLDTCGPMGGADLMTASIVYLAWQALYYLKIEVFDRGACVRALRAWMRVLI